MHVLSWRWTRRRISMLVAWAVAIAVILSQEAVSAELLMLEQDGCVDCEKFDREIAPAYPKTAEGKQAALRRIDINQKWPEDLADIKPTTLTPTFILIENNEELGRMYGYSGDEYFWFLLGELLENLNTELPTTSR